MVSSNLLLQPVIGSKSIREAGISPQNICAIGITNQRETTLVWDRNTGIPLTNAIVWQDRRTANICEELKEDGWEEYISDKTGLIIDAYFSGTKLKWILDNIDDAREKALNGELAFGTIDSWLIWKLTGGKSHATDYSNASRTMLYDIKSLRWDGKLLDRFSIPENMLPEVLPSSGYFGSAMPEFFGNAIAICGVAGDQQAALFGQACFTPGDVKNTYGTGCFMLMNTGLNPVKSVSGLLTTIAWGIKDEITYALEGSVFVAGAAIQWLRDGLQILENASESESLALSVDDTDGVYFVPAFAGLGAPHWDMYARGILIGLTRGTSRAHIVRAALESIAYQTKDILEAMEKDSGIQLHEMKVDGGGSVNNFLMQFQADLMNVSVKRPQVSETTAFGAALLAGMGCGLWTIDKVKECWKTNHDFNPSMRDTQREKMCTDWQRALDRSRNWGKTLISYNGEANILFLFSLPCFWL